MNEWIVRALNVGTGTVDWKSTFILAAMRSAAAGVTWAFLMMLSGNFENVLPFLLLGAPIGVLFMVPLALIALIGAKVFPPIGLLGLIPLVYIVSGDPLLWLVERLRPGTVPMDDFKPINGKTILIVFNSEVVEFVQNARDEAVASATQIGRDTFAKFREQASARADMYRREGSSAAGPESDSRSDQQVYEAAKAEFQRLAAAGSDAEALREQLNTISELCDAECAVAGPYIFIVNMFAQSDLVGKFDLIIGTLRDGHTNCAGNRAYQEEIETCFFGVGKLCWNGGHEELAFRAYMDGLDRWRQAGNRISQSSPLVHRIAFGASRMFAKNAMEKHANMDLSVEFLDFCEASGVDINLEIDISDAPRVRG